MALWIRMLLDMIWYYAWKRKSYKTTSTIFNAQYQNKQKQQKGEKQEKQKKPNTNKNSISVMASRTRNGEMEA